MKQWNVVDVVIFRVSDGDEDGDRLKHEVVEAVANLAWQGNETSLHHVE